MYRVLGKHLAVEMTWLGHGRAKLADLDVLVETVKGEFKRYQDDNVLHVYYNAVCLFVCSFVVHLLRS